MSLTAGRNINVESTVGGGSNTYGDKGQAGYAQYNRVVVNQVAGLYVTNPGGTLVVNAGNDVNLTGAQVNSGGVVSIRAGNNVNLNASV